MVKIFKGAIKNNLPYKGQLKVLQQEKVKFVYDGQFVNNRMGGEGQLQIPNKLVYRGAFHNNEK